MTIPSAVSDLLIFLASSRVCPVAPVLLIWKKEHMKRSGHERTNYEWQMEEKNHFWAGQVDQVQLSGLIWPVLQILLIDGQEHDWMTSGTLFVHVCTRGGKVHSPFRTNCSNDQCHSLVAAMALFDVPSFITMRVSSGEDTYTWNAEEKERKIWNNQSQNQSVRMENGYRSQALDVHSFALLLMNFKIILWLYFQAQTERSWSSSIETQKKRKEKGTHYQASHESFPCRFPGRRWTQWTPDSRELPW